MANRREKVYDYRSMKKYARGAERSQRRLEERNRRKLNKSQDENTTERQKSAQPGPSNDQAGSTSITQQQPGTQQLQTPPTQPHKQTNSALNQLPPNLTIAEQSQTILNWNMAKTSLENENLKKIVEEKDQSIIMLTKENIELRAREEMYKKQLREAEARAVKAGLEAKESAREANEGLYRKLYHTHMANLRNVLHLSEEMIKETFQGESRINEYSAAVKYHSNSIYLKNDKRIPIDKLKDWANEPNAELIRKSHERGFKYVAAARDGGKGERLIKVKDDKSGDKSIGEYNLKE